MASGVDDSAKTLYFSDVNYNSGTTPKQSFKQTDLQSRFLYNQSNYQVSINKLKLESLSGVRLGYVEYNDWEVSLTLPSSSGGTGITAASYVNLPGQIPTTAYFEYYTTLDRNYNIQLYRGNGTSLGDAILLFAPKDKNNNQITPFYSVYNPVAQIFWVATYRNIYIYDNNGTYITDGSLSANIRSASFSVNTQDMIITQNDPITNIQQVSNYTYSGGTLSFRGGIGLQKDGSPLTDVRCAATDGTSIVFIWFNTANQSFYCDTASYATFQISSEGQMGSNITNPASIVVNTIDNSFLVVNDSYDVLKQLSANIHSPYTPGTEVEMYNVKTGAQMFKPSGIVGNSEVSYFQAFDNTQTVFAVETDASINTSWYQPSYPWNSITSANWSPSPVGGANFPFSITYYPTNDGMPLLLGFYYDDSGNVFFNTIGANGQWINCFQLPSTPVIQPSTNIICADNTGQIWMTDTQHLYKFSIVPKYTAGQAPYLNFGSGGTFVQVNQSESTHNISCVVWDAILPNVGYCLVAENNAIYKILYNPQANSITLQEFFYDSTKAYKGYLSKCWNYSGQTNNAELVKYNITSFTQLSTLNISDTYVANLAISRPSDLLYVPNTSGNILSVYNYISLEKIQNITGYQPFGGIGVYTSIETTPPTKAQSAYYDLQEIVDAINAAFLSCYNNLKTSITPMPVSNAPTLTLDYTTHRLTLTYDPKWIGANQSINIDDDLLRYVKFPSTKPTPGIWNQLVLSPTGSITQSQETFYLLNTIDKLIITTNMSMNSDFSGQYQSSVFTDLDIDTQTANFNGGSLLYSAILLRKYDLITNTTLRSLTYQFSIQYVDTTTEPYLIPPGCNVSIKYEFDRVY